MNECKFLEAYDSHGCAIYICTECEKEFERTDLGWEKPNFCSNCGSKVKKKKGERNEVGME